MEVLVEEPSLGRVLNHVVDPFGKIGDYFGGDVGGINREVNMVQSVLRDGEVLDVALHQSLVWRLQVFPVEQELEQEKCGS